ncbi:unnamed protein product [Caenorhabditis auriculariae]|uniref:DUF4440 domain-containing protein n=1 Tax=Caenorhabditis auriculariae TaxID=2777116 RepID=A0A8S1HL16_9PELO|nr:unnamed protein product [Caenorhabditis auriculariae]
MSEAEFKKLHEEMRELRKAGKHDEFVKKFAAQGATFIGPMHDPLDAASLAGFANSPKGAALAGAEIDVTIDEIKVIGDVAIDRCSLIVKLPTGEKKGWSLSLWVKEDGAWKIRNACSTFKLEAP